MRRNPTSAYITPRICCLSDIMLLSTYFEFIFLEESVCTNTFFVLCTHLLLSSCLLNGSLGAICNSNKFHYADHHDHTFSLVSHYIQASAYIHIVHTYMDNSFHNRQYVLNSEYTISNWIYSIAYITVFKEKFIILF